MEAVLTELRYALLANEGPRGAFDFARLLNTNHYLFQDTYAWAGQMRTVTLAKAPFDGGPLQFFTAPSQIQDQARTLFNRLAKQNYLRGLKRLAFARQAAQLFAELNQLHAFREGNGRTQRAFVEALAVAAGYELRFDVISRERMISASVEAMTGPPEQFTRMFDEITDPARVAPLLRAIEFFERHDFDWNDRYLAAMVPGSTYEGLLVGQDGGNFMLASHEYIWIGHSADLPGERDPESVITVAARTEFA